MIITIYPRKGTETAKDGNLGTVGRLQFIPARGRKPAKSDVSKQMNALQFIPARGRKQTKTAKNTYRKQLQFIPARGRKREFIYRKVSNYNYNLSPQGDGNGGCPEHRPLPEHYNLSPQGDGNFGAIRVSNKTTRLQFIPARGRKLCMRLGRILRSGITIYPRKGTETFVAILYTSFTFYYNLSPQGDGNVFRYSP